MSELGVAIRSRASQGRWRNAVALKRTILQETLQTSIIKTKITLVAIASLGGGRIEFSTKISQIIPNIKTESPAMQILE